MYGLLWNWATDTQVSPGARAFSGAAGWARGHFNIETGNTKLSLSVFVDIASALEVQADALLYDQPRDSISTAANEIGDVLENCSAAQARILAEVVKTAKQAMDAYL